MAYTFVNKHAKKCCKRTILVQVIVENVVTCFWDTLYFDGRTHRLTDPRLLHANTIPAPGCKLGRALNVQLPVSEGGLFPPCVALYTQLSINSPL